MSGAIPFVRELAFEYGQAHQASPLIRRLVARNPGPFTYTGTGVYIIGQGQVAIIDPGPDMPEHKDAILRAIEGETLTHIFITHAHLDHSPMARPLARATGAKIYACGTPVIPTESDVRMEAGDDLTFRPDVAVEDGDVFAGPGWTIEAVFTPGHTSHHMAWHLVEESALFSGDHVMGWSTTVISPPDGHMGDYMASLQKVIDRDFASIWPTHGPEIREPRPFVRAYLAHRQRREQQILDQVRAGLATIREMVPVIYKDVDQRLHPAACHSVLAHTIQLVRDGRLQCDGEPCVHSVYRHA